MKTIFCITGLAIQGLAMSVQAQTGKPNIVVIMTDQQRADLCGREGFPRRRMYGSIRHTL